MAMILPDDVLGVIHEFSRPYRTRPDWRTCKQYEAWKIEQYYAYGRFLFHNLEWFAVTDESGYRVFYDSADVLRHMRETNMVNRILRFEETLPMELNIIDLLYVWFDHNWAAGIAALPP
jgi:hypothetical protein